MCVTVAALVYAVSATAERLLVEMRDKAGDWLEELSPTSEVSAQLEDPVSKGVDHRAEAEQALVSLGYKLTEAAKLIASADAPDEASSEELIRLALRAAGGGR